VKKQNGGNSGKANREYLQGRREKRVVRNRRSVFSRWKRVLAEAGVQNACQGEEYTTTQV